MTLCFVRQACLVSVPSCVPAKDTACHIAEEELWRENAVVERWGVGTDTIKLPSRSV